MKITYHGTPPVVNRSRGLGDTVEKFTNATGIAKVVKNITAAVGIEDCGCGARRDTLNRIFPYNNANI